MFPVTLQLKRPTPQLPKMGQHPFWAVADKPLATIQPLTKKKKSENAPRQGFFETAVNKRRNPWTARNTQNYVSVPFLEVQHKKCGTSHQPFCTTYKLKQNLSHLLSLQSDLWCHKTYQ